MQKSASGPVLQQVGRTCVRYRGRQLIYFGGCDYFRMASHPQILRAARIALREFGLNVAASRHTTGNHWIYGKLENALSKFFAAPTAILTPNGYATNLAVAQSLRERFSHALIDQYAHPSLQDASVALGRPVHAFAHRNPDDLRRVLKASGKAARPLVLTDGMFSHTGATAPVDAYLSLLPENGFLLVDDSHAAGTLGAKGRGSVEGLGFDRIIQSITLSKAFGVFGGAILSAREPGAAINSNARILAGSTPLPLPLAWAALASVDILRTNPEFQMRLAANIRYVIRELTAAGFTFKTAGPILALAMDNPQQVRQFRRRLLQNGIYPPFIHYPGPFPNGFFRFALSSEHTRPQLDALIRSFGKNPQASQHKAQLC